MFCVINGPILYFYKNRSRHHQNTGHEFWVMMDLWKRAMVVQNIMASDDKNKVIQCKKVH